MINTYIIITFIITMTIMFVAAIFVFLKRESKNQEREYGIFYNNTMDTLVSDLRRVKHNYNNMLDVFSGFIKSEDWDGLKKYFEELIEENYDLNRFNHIVLLNIKNAGIISLLDSKLEYAKRIGLDIRILVHDEIREINMKISELCEIIGILADNAIEAAAGSRGKHMRVEIRQSEDSVNFTIENSTDVTPRISDIFKKDYSTKGNSRGLGLWVVKRITDKYTNVMLNTCIYEGIFKQELIIS